MTENLDRNKLYRCEMKNQSDFINKVLLAKLEENLAFEEIFVKYLSNKENPLGERWENFQFATANKIFNKTKPFIYHSPILEKVENFTWYDYFGFNKYQTILFTEVIEALEERLKECREFDEWEYALVRSKNDIDQLKEEFLSTGFVGFELDW